MVTATTLWAEQELAKSGRKPAVTGILLPLQLLRRLIIRELLTCLPLGPRPRPLEVTLRLFPRYPSYRLGSHLFFRHFCRCGRGRGRRWSALRRHGSGSFEVLGLSHETLRPGAIPPL